MTDHQKRLLNNIRTILTELGEISVADPNTMDEETYTTGVLTDMYCFLRDMKCQNTWNE